MIKKLGEAVMRRWLVRVLAFVSPLAFATPAFAEPPPPAMLGSLRGIDGVLVGAFGGGHGQGVGAPHGWFLGADVGWAWLIGTTDIVARSTSGLHEDAWCFGARAGYQLASGLAVQARFDRLGVSAPDGSGSVMTASAGVRYSVPVVPMPFAEALIGPAFHGSSIELGVGLGVGASLAIARHIVFEASLRDWLIDMDGVHHVPTVMLGITTGFAG